MRCENIPGVVFDMDWEAVRQSRCEWVGTRSDRRAGLMLFEQVNTAAKWKLRRSSWLKLMVSCRDASPLTINNKSSMR